MSSQTPEFSGRRNESANLDSSAPANDFKALSTSAKIIPFREQTFLDRYGSRFWRVEVGLLFGEEADEQAPQFAHLPEDTDNSKMEGTKALINKIIEEQQLAPSIQEHHIHMSIGTATFLCSPVAMDTIVSELRLHSIEFSISDLTGVRLVGSTALPLPKKPFLWQGGNFTDQFDPTSKGFVDRFILDFCDPVSSVSISEIAEIIQSNGLEKTIGVDVSGMESGHLILTCSMSELSLFASVSELNSIVEN